MSPAALNRTRFSTEAAVAWTPGHTFNCFWHGAPLNILHFACLTSFLRNGHSVRLFSYEPFSVPDGVELADARTILPESELFAHRNNFTGAIDYAPFADLFCLRFLYESGGWFCDVDTVCLTSRYPAVDRAWAREFPAVRPDNVGNGQLRFPRHDPFVAHLVTVCEERRARPIDRREDLGPNLLSRAIFEGAGFPLDLNADPQTFYPVSWVESWMLLVPRYASEITARAGRAVFLPVYQSLVQYMGLSFAMLPPQGSYLWSLYRELVPDRLRGPAIEEREVLDAARAWFAPKKWAIDELLVAAGSQVVADLGLG